METKVGLGRSRGVETERLDGGRHSKGRGRDRETESAKTPALARQAMKEEAGIMTAKAGDEGAGGSAASSEPMPGQEVAMQEEAEQEDPDWEWVPTVQAPASETEGESEAESESKLVLEADLAHLQTAKDLGLTEHLAAFLGWPSDCMHLVVGIVRARLDPEGPARSRVPRQVGRGLAGLPVARAHRAARAVQR